MPQMMVNPGLVRLMCLRRNNALLRGKAFCVNVLTISIVLMRKLQDMI